MWNRIDLWGLPLVLLSLAARPPAEVHPGPEAAHGPGTPEDAERELDGLRADLARREAGGRDHFVAQTRQKAVRRLAEIGTPDAWELVLGALEDPSPRVADEAQWVLADVRDPEVLEEVLGRDGLRSRDPLVRCRVAEALGRIRVGMDGEDVERALVKALGDRDPEVRRMLYWSVERLARGRGFERREGKDGKLLSACWRGAEKDRDVGVRAVALRAAAALEQGAARPRLVEALEAPSPAVRAAAVGALARLRGASTLECLRESTDDPSPLVRRAVVKALERLGSRPALQLLIERLEPEPRPRLQRLVRDTLQGMTGMLFKDDPRPWRVFAERLPADWRAERTRRRPVRDAERGTQAPSAFGGLPVLSDRIAFLIDFSGSIWMEREDGRTRKEVVDEELEKALRSLPPETRFNVIPYSDAPEPWRDELVPAKPRNVERAIEWFRDCKLDGRGNLYDAVLVALEDPDVDTLVLLTDGAPTGGHRWNVELMTRLLSERNRAHGVAFDAVLVSVRGKLREAWEGFCEASGGESVVVDW